MTCLPCHHRELRPQFHIEVINAVVSTWRSRLTCRSCGATGYNDPATRAWVFFDSLIQRPERAVSSRRNRGKRQC